MLELELDSTLASLRLRLEDPIHRLQLPLWGKVARVQGAYGA